SGGAERQSRPPPRLGGGSSGKTRAPCRPGTLRTGRVTERDGSSGQRLPLSARERTSALATRIHRGSREAADSTGLRSCELVNRSSSEATAAAISPTLQPGKAPPATCGARAELVAVGAPRVYTRPRSKSPMTASPRSIELAASV